MVVPLSDDSRINCPLCQTDRVRVVAVTKSLVICACDKCAAQFTITNRRETERESLG